MSIKIILVTLFPEIVKNTLEMGVIGQAISEGKILINVMSPRQFVSDIHKTVDDRPYGGGDGMLMLANPLADLIESLGSREHLKTIYMSPHGSVFSHSKAVELASLKDKTMVFICGRYGGIDQRFINTFVDEELSLGDFVLSGGELAALSMIDAIGRQVNGVLGHEDSSKKDSFALDGLLESVSFTRPREWREQLVPSILLSGNHEKIDEFKNVISMIVTFKKRKKLFENYLRSKKFTTKQIQKYEKLLLSLSENELNSLSINKKEIEEFLIFIAQV